MDFNRFAKINLVPEDDRGISLIEVMMALTVLLVGILAYAKSSSAILGTNIQSTKESIAITLAQDLIETLKVSPVSDGMGAVDETVNSEGIVDGSGTPFERSWSVTANPTLPRFFDVQVTVEWQNQGTRSVTLNTQISQ
jgi:prepilin-type N-terminal cleavage/methylation domain-containing protein